MKIQMDVDGTRVTATLDDNPTSRDFISLLPLTLTLEEVPRDRPCPCGSIRIDSVDQHVTCNDRARNGQQWSR
jgi:hypothetical protein